MSNTRCKSCNEPIVWMRTTHGSNMPVNAQIVDDRVVPIEYSDGNVRRVPDRRPENKRLFVETVKAGEGVWKSHFATCKHADEWRGRSR